MSESSWSFVAIYDCWLTGYWRVLLLGQAMRDANERWLQMLGPMYDFFLSYLEDPKHGDSKKAEWARRIKATWKRRVSDKGWPTFAYSPAELVELRIESSVGELVLPHPDVTVSRRVAIQRLAHAINRQKELHEESASAS